MKIKPRHSGLSLTEMLVVVGGISLLVFFGLPAVRTLFQSFESESGTRTLIQSALASARTIAAKEQRYAGVRFQRAYDAGGPLIASQYIVFIIHEEPQNMTDPTETIPVTEGFRVVDGIKPIKLPDSVGVAAVLGGNMTDSQLADVTSFSILFSPTGKLVVRQVRTRNRDGRIDDTSRDDLFNTQNNVQATPQIGMFIQDDYSQLGLAQELSRNSFLIYDRRAFEGMAEPDQVSYAARLMNEKMIYVNAYTGRLIRGDR